MKKNLLYALLLLAVLAVAFHLGERHGRGVVVRTDTVRVTRTDTIRDTAPSLVAERRAGYVRVRTISVYDTLTVTDTVRAEMADSLLLPLTQREYGDDSTYRAWVSGYEPRLDSIRVYRNTVHETVTIQTLHTSKGKQSFWSRFNAGVQAGYGIGIDDKKGHPYVGVGVGFAF